MKALFYSRQPLRRLGLLLDPQRVIELVEEPAKRDAQRQFDDLRLAEMLPQPVKQTVGDAAGVLPRGDRILDDDFINLVELRMIAVIEQPVGARGRDALHRKKRLVMRN